jgi:hypothetical protein
VRTLKDERLPTDYQSLYQACRAAYDDLIAFVTTPEFRAAHDEMVRLDPRDRPAFVKRVFLDDRELLARGIKRPDDVMIQRSAFGDRRPTLFAVKKWLPSELQMFWENVNITFDNEYDDASIARDATAWKPPVPVDVQDAYIAGRLNTADLDALVAELEPLTRLGLGSPPPAATPRP